MCSECLQTPCHPRCPNAPEPPIVCQCDNCGRDIRDGDDMYVIGSDRFCEECIDNGKTTADIDECI